MSLNPTSIIKVNLGLGPNGTVQKFFTNTCRKHMDKYVPKRDGTLREVVRIETDKITYQTPYAHAQYVGIVNGGTVKKYTTPGTGPYWDRRMVSAEIKQVVQETQDFIDRGAK